MGLGEKPRKGTAQWPSFGDFEKENPKSRRVIWVPPLIVIIRGGHVGEEKRQTGFEVSEIQTVPNHDRR